MMSFDVAAVPIAAVAVQMNQSQAARQESFAHRHKFVNDSCHRLVALPRYHHVRLLESVDNHRWSDLDLTTPGMYAICPALIAANDARIPQLN
jgi:hypothetical protein